MRECACSANRCGRACLQFERRKGGFWERAGAEGRGASVCRLQLFRGGGRGFVCWHFLLIRCNVM
jgi:hypothetical protein